MLDLKQVNLEFMGDKIMKGIPVTEIRWVKPNTIINE